MAASSSNIRAGRAYIELFLKDGALLKGLNKTGAALTSWGEGISNIGKKMAAVGAAVAAPMLAASVAFAKSGDEIAKMSRRTGVSVEALSELGYAAKLSGSDAEGLEKSLRIMQKTIGAAELGSKGATDSLALLGLSLDDIKGLKPEEQFKLIADRISEFADPTERAAVAMKLFGKGGTALLPLIEGGAKGISKLTDEAKDLGITLSGKDASAAEKFNDSLTRLWAVIKRGRDAIGSALAPVLEGMAGIVTRLIVNTTEWIKANGDIVVRVFEVAAAVVGAGVGLYILGTAITFVGGVLTGLGTILGAVGFALGAVTTVISFMATPVGLLVIALAGITGWALYKSGAISKAASSIAGEFSELGRVANESLGGITDAIKEGNLSEVFGIAIDTMKVLWLDFSNWVIQQWRDMVNKVAKLVPKGANIQSDLNAGAAAWAAAPVTSAKEWLGGSESSYVMPVWGLVKKLFPKVGEKLRKSAAEGGDSNERSVLASIANDNQTEKAANNAWSAQIEADHQRQKAAAQAAIDAAKEALHGRNMAMEQAHDDAERMRERKAAMADADARERASWGLGRKFPVPKIQAEMEKIGTRGTFGGFSPGYLGSIGGTDRLTKAAEETAKNTAAISKYQRDHENDGGGEYGP